MDPSNKRNWLGIGGAATMVTVVGGTTAIYYQYSEDAQRDRQRAESEAIFRNSVEQTIGGYLESKKDISRIDKIILKYGDRLTDLEDFEGDATERFQRNEETITDNDERHDQQIIRAARRIEHQKMRDVRLKDIELRYADMLKRIRSIENRLLIIETNKDV